MQAQMAGYPGQPPMQQQPASGYPANAPMQQQYYQGAVGGAYAPAQPYGYQYAQGQPQYQMGYPPPPPGYAPYGAYPMPPQQQQPMQMAQGQQGPQGTVVCANAFDSSGTLTDKLVILSFK